MPERTEICKECHRPFLISEREQQEFKSRGWSLPRRCPSCRQQAKSETTSKAQTSAPMPKEPVQTSVGGPRHQEYLAEGYFLPSGEMRPEIFASEARDAAGKINHAGVSPTALRRFYNRLKAIAITDVAFDEKINQLRGLARDAEYAKNKDPKVVPPILVHILNANVELALSDDRSLAAFVEHFKSILAYTKVATTDPFAVLEGVGLPPGYLQGGYYESSQKMKKEIFTDWAQGVVTVFAKQFKPLSMTALRRFYNQLKAIELSYATHNNFQQTVADLYALERDAVYAAGRQVVPGVFAGFIARNVGLARHGSTEFKGFVEHFKSVVAYGKGKLSEGGARV